MLNQDSGSMTIMESNELGIIIAVVSLMSSIFGIVFGIRGVYKEHTSMAVANENRFTTLEQSQQSVRDNLEALTDAVEKKISHCVDHNSSVAVMQTTLVQILDRIGNIEGAIMKGKQ